MASDLALSTAAVNFLNSVGLGDLTGLTRAEALHAVPGELAATLFGMCWMGDLEDQLLAQKYMLTNVTDQIDLNNKGVEIWKTREQIAKAKWPADEAKQREIRDLLAADLAAGVPADPPVPPLTQVITSPNDVDDPDDPDDTPLEKLENTLKTQQATADAVLKKLNGYADAGEAMVDWPTDASTEAGMSAWLSAQGVSSADLSSDAVWLTDFGSTVVKPDDLVSTIDFGSFSSKPSSGSSSADRYQWVRDLTSSDSSEQVAWNGEKLLYVTQKEDVSVRGDGQLPEGTVVLNWSGNGNISGTVYTAVDSSGEVTKFFVPDSSALGTVVPDDLGKTYTINGETVRLWSDGTSVYTVNAGDMTVEGHLTYALHVFKGDMGSNTTYLPATYFQKYGGMDLATSKPVITSVDGSRRAAWASVFENKISTLQSNNSNFTSAISTSNLQVQESVTNYNVASSWVTNMLKVWGDLIRTFLSKI
jgi:hypothetical protein